jgi:F-box and WD-40 domain protein MET30
VSEDTTVRLWDRVSGAGLAAHHGHVYPVWCVAADCLGVNFVTGSHDRTARLWRPEVAHPLRVYIGHDGDVDCARQADWTRITKELAVII